MKASNFELPLSQAAVTLLGLANKEAAHRRRDHIKPEHVFIASSLLLDYKYGEMERALDFLAVRWGDAYLHVLKSMGIPPPRGQYCESEVRLPWGDELRRAVEHSRIVCKRSDLEEVGTGMLLLGILNDNNKVSRVFRGYSVTYEMLGQALAATKGCLIKY